ncbi:MAG: DUF2298 domain-containing protein, partial [Actinomycetota bacterium]|nr:DUF2298 domain-containing protein [Actinomycetota bacterium]
GGRRRCLAGVLAACLVCGAGTLESGIQIFADAGPLRAYDWFGPSRLIPQAITEFPAFSFLLGDLHAHLLAVPFTLLALAFGLQAARGGPSRRDVVPAGIAVGVLYAINSWSYPVAAGVVALSTVVWVRGRPRAGAWRAAALWSLGVLWVSVLAVLPFWLAFDAATGGIGLVEERRSFSQFVRDQSLFLGVLLWVLLAAFAHRLLGSRRPLRTAAWLAVAAIVAGSLLAPADLAGPALVAGLVAVALRAAWGAPEAGERWGWLVIAAGLACVLGPELVYVRDEFDGSELFRMNTVFKLGFQAWILLAVMAAVVLALGRRWLPAGAWRLWAPVAVVGLALAAIYPVAGTYARKAAFADGPRLGGLAWLERDAPGDVAAIAWLRDETAGDAVVLEAVGDDYSEFGHARISTFSGRATVLGWPGHELQWGHDPGSRRADVERIYRDPDPAAVRPLLERYGVDYVVAGPLERADYGDDGLAKFDRLGRRVLDREGTTVWRLNTT